MQLSHVSPSDQRESMLRMRSSILSVAQYEDLLVQFIPLWVGGPLGLTGW